MRTPRALRLAKPNPLAVSLARYSSAVAISAAILAAASAATKFWDADTVATGNSSTGANLGGSGPWDTGTTANWWTGSVDTTWASGDSAVFTGTPGTATIAAGGVSATDVAIRTSGYTIAGGGLTIATTGTTSLGTAFGTPVTATISAPITGGLRYAGNKGTLSLRGNQTGIAGAITLRGGTIEAATTVTEAMPATFVYTPTTFASTVGLTFNGSSTFRVDNLGQTGAVTKAFGALTPTAGDGTVDIVRSAAQDVTVSFTSATPRAEGATVLLSANGNSSALGSTAKFTINGTAAGFMPGYFVAENGNAASLAVYDTTSNSARPLIYNTFANSQSISGGSSNLLTNNFHYLVTGPLAGAQGTTAQSIQSLAIAGAFNIGLTNGNTLTIASGVTPSANTGPATLLKTGGVNALGTSAATIAVASGGASATLAAGGTKEFIIRTDNVDDLLTIASSVTLSATSLTKSGDGTLVIAGTNGVTGTTYVNAGKLSITGGSFGTGPANLVLNGGTYEVLAGANDNTSQTFATNKTVVVNTPSVIAAGRLAANTASANKVVTFNGLQMQAGSQGLQVDPATGYAVQIAGATLNDASPAILNVTGTQSSTTAAGLSLTGVVQNGAGVTPGLIKRGTGTLALTAVNTFGGAGADVEVQEGVVSINADAGLGNAANRLVLNVATGTEGLLATGDVNSARSVLLAQGSGGIEVAAGKTVTLNGQISSTGAAGLTKRGAGALTLGNNTNTFGGVGSVLDFQQGVLTVSQAGALGTVDTVRLGATSTLGVAGDEFRITVAGPSTLSANFQLGNATGTTVNKINVSDAVTLSGVISSATTTSNFNKVGAGSLNLTNEGNTFGGVGSTLEVSTGSLIVSSGGALGDPNNTIKLSMGAADRFQATGTSAARQNFILNGTAASTTFSVDSGKFFTLNGLISNGAAPSDLVKTGLGTLALGNSAIAVGLANDFGGTGKVIDVQQGVLAAEANESLGNAANVVKLSATTAGQGFLATGTFTVPASRTFQLLNDGTGANTSTIGVTQGNTLFFNSVFAGNANAALFKNDLGSLTLSIAQPAYAGAVTIDAGAIRLIISTSTLLGTGGTTASGTTIRNIGSLEFSGSTVALTNEWLTLSPSGDNTVMVGSNFGGAIRAGAGVLTNATIPAASRIDITGVQTNGNSRSVLIGSDAGSTLTIQAPISINNTATSGTFNLLLGGESANSNLLSSTIANPVAGVTVNIVKTGGGKWVLNQAQTAVSGLQVRSGTLVVNASGDGTGAGAGNIVPATSSLTMNGTGTLIYDNVNTTVTKTQTLGALLLSGGDATVNIQRNASPNAFVTLTNAPARSPGATGLFYVSGSQISTLGTNAAFNITGGTNGFLNPGAFAALSALNTTGFAWYDPTKGIRSIVYTGTPDTGAVQQTTATPIAGTGTSFLQITGTNAVPVSNATLKTLQLTGQSTLTIATGQTLTMDAGGTFNAGAILKTGGSTTATIAAADATATLTAGSGKELIVRADQSNDILTISANISNTTGALTKSGLGELILSGTNAWTGATYLNAGKLTIQSAAGLPTGSAVNMAGGTLSYAYDGDGTGRPEIPFAVSNTLNVTGNSSLTLTRLTSTVAANKTVSFGGLSIGGNTLTVITSNGYGARIGGSTAFTDSILATFNVSGMQPSNLIAGLTLAGTITSTSPVGFVKTNGGTLDLGSGVNTFGGAGALIDIQNGFVAAGSDGALGNLNNGVILNSTTGNQGFRATGTFATDRTFTLGQSTAAFEVTEGNVLTLNTAINLGGATGNAISLAKGDNGVLHFGADAPAGWSGAININAGAIRIKTGGGLGAAVANRITLAASPGTALQLSGTSVIYSPYPLSLNSTGINNNGQLENVSGNNTWTGPITLTAASGATIGASGGTLNVTGVLSATNPASSTVAATPLTVSGTGNTLISSVLTSPNLALVKVGTGNLTLTAANTSFTGNINVIAGTLTIGGAGAKIGGVGPGTFNSSSNQGGLLGGTGALNISSGATLTVNDTGTPLPNRLGGRIPVFSGGTFNLIGSSAGNTVESVAANGTNFGRGLTVVNVTAGTGKTAQLNFAGSFGNLSLAQNATVNGVAVTPVAASVLFRGTNLGQPLVDTTTAHNPIANTAGVTLSNGTATLLTFNGQTGLINTTNKGILPWALVDSDPINGVGTSFATFDSATNPRDSNGTVIPGLNPIRALNQVTEMSNSLVANANVNLSSPVTLSARTFNVNALNFAPNLNSITLKSGGGITVNSSEGIVFLSLSSGGILAQAGNTGLTAGVLNATSGSSPLNIWTPGAATILNVTSTVNGGNGATVTGLVKAGAGTLTLSSPLTPIAAVSSVYAGLSANSFNGLTSINEGTLKLNSGINTLFPNTFVQLSSGATLDLNGNSQYLQSIFSDGIAAGAGGTVTNTSGSGNLVLNTDARTFAGSMSNAAGAPLNFLRSGVSTGTYTLVAPQTYTGITQLSGGTTTLRDAGSLSGTSSLQVNFAGLALDNTGTLSVSDRLNNAAPVTLRGGTLTLAGRPLTSLTEVAGALTVAPGLSTITVNASSGVAVGTNVASAELNFASLTRQTGSMINFVGQSNAVAATLGALGSNPRVTFTNAPTLTQKIIGGWAIATGTSGVPEFASYVPGLGIGPLGASGFATYDTASLTTSTLATQNAQLTAAPGALAGNATVNALSIAGNFTPGITFSSDSAVLNIVSGGLIRSGTTATSAIGAATAGTRGQITSGGNVAGLASELLIYQGNSTQNLQIFSQVVDHATGAPTSLVLGGTGSISLAPQVASTYSGGTVVNGITTNTSGAAAGITVIPGAGGLIINNAAFTANAVSQIATSTAVTINGGGSLTLTGDNTIGALTFNNTGGTQATPTVNTGGTLIVTGAVTASSSNPTTTATIAGKVSLTGAKSFVINPISFNGVNTSPTQASFILQGADGAGGIAKTGTGILQFNTQDVFTGAVTVSAGGIQYGAANAGSRFAAVSMANNTVLNLAGNSTIIGSLASVNLTDTNSVVTNSSSTGATLTLGFNNTSTTFNGRFSRFGDGIANTLNITKIGTGKLILGGNGNTTTGSLSVQIGEVAYTGSGASTFSNNTVVTGGTLTLDNTSTNVNNRFGGNITSSTLTMSGGNLNVKGNASVDTTETIDTLAVTNGAGVINLTPNQNHQLTFKVATAFNAVGGGGTLLINNLSADDGAGLATIDGSTLNLNAPAGAGSGFPVSETAVRPDIIANNGTTTGFVTKDAFTNKLRLLDSGFGELLDSMPSGSGTPANYELSTAQTIAENTVANSLVLKTGSSITTTAPTNYGRYSPTGTALSQIVISGGILVPDNNTTSITAPLLTTGQNVPLTFHVLGSSALTVNGDVAAGTAGITKSGTGTLTLNSRGFYSGPTTVNEGTLVLNGGQNQAIAVAPGTATPATISLNNVNVLVNPATLSILNVNGGTLNLSGLSQSFAQLASNNPNPGFGGTITSSTAAALLSATSTGTTFAGVIGALNGSVGDPISFEKQGAGGLVLTGVSNYSGSTVLRGGSISLRDQGQLVKTSDLSISNGTLTVDNSGATSAGSFTLSRLPAGAPVSLYGGTFTFQAGGSANYSTTLNTTTVRLKGGANTVSANATTGGTSTLTLGTLLRDDTTSTVNFTGTSLGNTSGFISKISFAQTSPTLTNNIIGPWAIVNGTDYASVVGAGVIGGLSNTGGGYLNYTAGISQTNLTTATATSNVNLGGSGPLGANTTLNVLRLNNTGVSALITFTPGTTLTLGGAAPGGGFLGNGAITFGSAPNEGNLTSSGANIFAYTNAASVVSNVTTNSTINSKIIDGSGGAVTLVKSGGAVLVLTGSNTYTGGTVVNQGTLTLSTNGANGTSVVSVPGNLTVANGAVVGLTAANQISTGAVVTIDGTGTLNLISSNTLAGLAFNNRGGNFNPEVKTADLLTLTSANAITSVNDTLSTTPLISGASLSLMATAPVISTSGSAASHLLITAPINNAGGTILKAGSGLLALNPVVTLTANADATSDVLSNVTDVGLAVGMSVSGPGVPVGARIINLLGATDGQIQLSAPVANNASLGAFVFSGSTVSTGFKVAGAGAGGIVLGSSSLLDPNDPNTVLNGPVGTGSLTLQDQGAILSDGVIRTIHNMIVAPNDFVIGTPIGSLNRALAGNGVNFAGKISLADNVSHTVTVTGLTNVSTFSGALVGVNAPLTKSGEGTLVLANANNGAAWNGTFNVAAGVLRSGADGAIPVGSQVNIATGAVFDLGGFSQVLSSVTGTGILGSSNSFSTTLFLGGISQTDASSNISSTFSGSIAGVADNVVNPLTLNLTKVGLGTVTLAGKNYISGPTKVNSGSLAVASTGQIQVAEELTVNAGAKLEIYGKITGTLSSGTLNASGVGATVTGYGIIDVNTTIGDSSILAPTSNGTSSLTINRHNLALGNGSTLDFMARQSLTGKTLISGPNATLNLPSGTGWTLKLENFDVAIPAGVKFVLFDGTGGAIRLNGNDGFSDGVGFVTIDFGNTGWSLNPTLADSAKGVHYDAANNDIVLIGVIPEPSTGALLIGALGGAFGFRRFRRRK